jgi:hypothetical protein
VVLPINRCLLLRQITGQAGPHPVYQDKTGQHYGHPTGNVPLEEIDRYSDEAVESEK